MGPPRWLRLRALWVYTVLVAFFLGPVSTPLNTLDVWWTVLSGQWIFQNHTLPDPDPFTSAPPTAQQMDAQWMAQLAYAAAYRVAGLPGIIVANAAAITLTFGLLLLVCVLATGRLRLSCGAIVFGYAAAATNLSARPQTLVYPIFTLFLLILLVVRRGAHPRLLWLLPVLTMVWANMHGSFFLGLVVIGCAALDVILKTRSLRPAGPLLLCLVACLAAACVTPYGPGSLVYVVSLGTNSVVRQFVTEWAPASVTSLTGGVFFALLALLMSLLIASRARLSVGEWLSLAVFTYLAISSVRAVAWWGVAVTPIVARLVAALPVPARLAVRPAQVGREKLLINGLVALVLGGLVVVSLPWLKERNPVLPADKRALIDVDRPAGAAEFMNAHVYGGTLLNFQGWGGYLDWALWPRQRPFLDGRIEIHPTNVWLDYFAIVYPTSQWQALLDQYGINELVLDAQVNQGLITALSQSGAWQQVYGDAQSAIFVRASSLSNTPAPD